MMKKIFLLVCILCGLSCPAKAEEGATVLSRLRDLYWMNDGIAPFAGLTNLMSLLPSPAENPAWMKNAIPFTAQKNKPMIALVIDDMGLDLKRSARALRLPATVTMAYIPYSSKIEEQTVAALAAGHEIIVHVPMEPERKSADPGPDFLGTQYPPEEIRRRIIKDLAAFDGYVGINNHMGSKFTQDRAGLEIVMQELKKRGLLFLDSRTIGTSIAEEVAKEYDLPSSHRDVFLDDEETDSFTEAALIHAENIARKKGSVIAIGHPRDITLKALAAWLSTLERKGFQLVPLTTVIQYRMDKVKMEMAAVHKQEASPH
jgi:hypothetical protein